MGEQTENAEVPNWLKELEAKREKRLIARLGHEAGAGAPCLTCDEKCPGLDLHFWRKICKNCKCAKENHDVHDDDIYGWAQFQLLGSKPNKSRKFKLPGKKEEIILEWTPKGPNETVDKFLKTLPPEMLPVRGSAAAQERKQLLQKQIPIHDIDPSLCHELTEAEQRSMNEYVAQLKQNSVGVGHVVQLGLNRGSRHTLGATDPHVLAGRFPAQLSNTQPVQLLAADSARKLQNLSLKERKGPTVAEDVQLGVKTGQVHDVNYPIYERVKTPDLYRNYEVEGAGLNNANFAAGISPKGQRKRGELPNYQHNAINRSETLQEPSNPGVIRGVSPVVEENVSNLAARNLPHYAPGTINTVNETKTPRKIGSVRDLAFSTYDPNCNYAPSYENAAPPKVTNLNQNHGARAVRDLPANHPNRLDVAENALEPLQVNIGAINDITYPTAGAKRAEDRQSETFSSTASPPPAQPQPPAASCHRCGKPFEDDAIVIGIERSAALFHASCFRCNGCNQSLADLVYFYHADTDEIYCGRDYAKIRGIPRCRACDELIFVPQYCLAENSTFHVKHFCCFECDTPLAGQNYVVEESQPLCLPCFDRLRANRCSGCAGVIGPDETGVSLKDVHFHATDACFACQVCRKPLLNGGKMLLREQRLYCSAVCYGVDKK